MNQFAKRLQSRLSAKGHRFSMDQCRQALYRFASSDQITEEEMTKAFNHLVNPSVPEPKIYTLSEEEDDFGIIAFNGITGECLTTDDIPVEDLPCLQPEPEKSEAETGAIAPAAPTSLSNNQATGGITQAEVTQAITQAVAQVGAAGNSEAIELLTSLANELSTDIKDVEQMASALITAYLGKRQNILASAIGTVQSLRSAQTNSFQAGLDQDFFAQKNRNKQQFLTTIHGMFN